MELKLSVNPQLGVMFFLANALKKGINEMQNKSTNEKNNDGQILGEMGWVSPEFQGKKEAGVESKSYFYRFFRLHEISEGTLNEYRLAMENVVSCLEDSGYSFVYVLASKPEGVKLYLGVAGVDEEKMDTAATGLQKSFEGNFLGAGLSELQDRSDDFNELKELKEELEQAFSGRKHVGLITGVPSYNENDGQQKDKDFQGVERIVNSLSGEAWQIVVVAEAGAESEVLERLDLLYKQVSELSSQIRHSIQRSENTGSQSTKTAGAAKQENTQKSVNDAMTKGSSSDVGVSVTQERTDKNIEALFEHLDETLVKRFYQGYNKGMFRTAIYAVAQDESVYQRLTRNIFSVFQGNAPNITPLKLHALSKGNEQLKLQDFLRIRQFDMPSADVRNALLHSIPFSLDQPQPATDAPVVMDGATWLNARELTLVAGLPSLELPGLSVRKNVDFALNIKADGKDAIELGCIVQHGRKLETSAVRISKSELNKHIFVSGVTGSGKTTTCMRLLLESKLPFLVIEPAKTEYRALKVAAPDIEIEYYVLGREDLTIFRLNPFELVSKDQNLVGHIDSLKAVFNAVFPMESAMPYIVEEAIIKAYECKGWDIYSSENYLVKNPWNPESMAWPMFSDFIAKLDEVIVSKGMGAEFTEKYRGSLVARFTNLTLGTKGRMLNTPRSINFSKLLDKKVVIELDELKDEQDKALLMGLILTRVAECMKQRHREELEFQHLTLLEEAHRLLTRPEPGESGSRKMGVEMFANLLSEVRKYGEGLIIADQIPNKLLPDVIKNTNTKIVHRLFAADDRDAIGDAIGLTDAQKGFLPMLMPGETIVYSGGWHAPVLAKIDEGTKTDGRDIPEELLREQGRNQLWEQRETLLPRLSKDISTWNAEESEKKEALADFVNRGSLVLNLILKGCMLWKENEYRVKNKQEGLMSMMRRELGLLAKKPPFKKEIMPSLLTLLFEDYNKIEGAAKSREIISNELPTLIGKLLGGKSEGNEGYAQVFTRDEKNLLTELSKIKAV